MKTNICGNCEYCDKSRVNELGMVRCAAKHKYVNIEDTCSMYFNRAKTEVYNKLLSVFDGGIT